MLILSCVFKKQLQTIDYLLSVRGNLKNIKLLVFNFAYNERRLLTNKNYDTHHAARLAERNKGSAKRL